VFLWQQGKLTDIGPASFHYGGAFGDAAVDPVAINDRGQLILSRFTASQARKRHAFLWQNGKLTDLGLLPGQTDATAEAIDGFGRRSPTTRLRLRTRS
jgi:probable HAF family extracellular repeat protein